jgi:hypothetical protein
MRVLVTLTPLMYREAIAHSLSQHRPALDLRIAAPEVAEELLVTLRGRWHAGLAQASAQMVDSHRHVEVEVSVHAQDHLDLGLQSLGADRRHVPSSFRCSGHFPPEEQERQDDTVRGHVRGELL